MENSREHYEKLLALKKESEMILFKAQRELIITRREKRLLCIRLNEIETKHENNFLSRHSESVEANMNAIQKLIS